MNFMNVLLKEQGGSLFIDEGSFQLEVAKAHQDVLKSFVGKELAFGIRPEDLEYTDEKAEGKVLEAEVTVVEPLGSEIHLYLNTDKHTFIAKVAPDHRFKVGDKVLFKVNLEKAKYFDLETERALVETPVMVT